MLFGGLLLKPSKKHGTFGGLGPDIHLKAGESRVENHFRNSPQLAALAFMLLAVNHDLATSIEHLKLTWKDRYFYLSSSYVQRWLLQIEQKHGHASAWKLGRLQLLCVLQTVFVFFWLPRALLDGLFKEKLVFPGLLKGNPSFSSQLQTLFRRVPGW